MRDTRQVKAGHYEILVGEIKAQQGGEDRIQKGWNRGTEGEGRQGIQWHGQVKLASEGR